MSKPSELTDYEIRRRSLVLYAVEQAQKKCVILLSITIVFLSTCALVWKNTRQSPFSDEFAHLIAGLTILKTGSFDLYEVNPPLAKVVAALPLYLCDVSLPQGDFGYRGQRPEWTLGQVFSRRDLSEARQFLTIGRCFLLPFWWIGCYAVFQLARESYGADSGLIALLLWTTLPESVTWASTVCPDAPAASMFVLAVLYSRRWIISADIKSTLSAGTTVGLALCTKFSMVVLFPLLILAAMCSKASKRTAFLQLVLLIFVSGWVVNSCYLFSGSFQRLGDFRFFSTSLKGPPLEEDEEDEEARNKSGNRWTSSWLGMVPIPVPRHVVEGIDLQLRDFEKHQWCYLWGKHQRGGWYHWYFVVLLMKIPIGCLLLVLLHLGRMALQRFRSVTQKGSRASQASSLCPDEAIIVIPGLCLFVLVSSQIAFTQYFRYVLPSLPLLCIFAARVGSKEPGPGSGKTVVLLATGWSVVSGVVAIPSSGSYVNEFVGRQQAGNAIAWAAVDWGQDFENAERWLEQNSNARPAFLLTMNRDQPRMLLDESGIWHSGDTDNQLGRFHELRSTPEAGWYIIGIAVLKNHSGAYEYLNEVAPVASIGYSTLVYHLSSLDVETMRANRKQLEHSVEQ